MSNSAVNTKLKEFFRLHHSIAFIGYGKISKVFEGNYEFKDFLLKLAEVMSDVVAKKYEETPYKPRF